MNYNKIKEISTSRGISFPQLAEKIGMTKRGFYASIENETLTIKTLERIAESLGIRVDEFFVDILGKDSLSQEFDKLYAANEAYQKRITELESIIRDKELIIDLIERTSDRYRPKREKVIALMQAEYPGKSENEINNLADVFIKTQYIRYSEYINDLLGPGNMTLRWESGEFDELEKSVNNHISEGRKKQQKKENIGQSDKANESVTKDKKEK
jgi:transcriptional regulator with XRE-family HTH domain